MGKTFFWGFWIFVFVNGCKNQQGKLAELYVVNDSINLGSIYLRDTADIEFILMNQGKIPLQIRSTGTSCGCSKAYLSDSIIKPGMQSKLIVKFFTADTGNIKKHIVIETNSKPIYKTLTFYGYLKPDSIKRR